MRRENSFFNVILIQWFQDKAWLYGRDNSYLARRRWNWITRRSISRQLTPESNHTCLPACDIIVVMRVRALYTPFTAKCSRPVRPAADQQDETTRAATLHRMFVRTSISLDIARRVRLYVSRRARFARAYSLPTISFTRTCDVTRYTLAFWSIQFVARIVTVDARLVVLFIFKTRQYAIQSRLLRDVCSSSNEKAFLHSHILF